MTKESSFDITSKVDGQAITDAVHQTTKEVEQRFDLKGTHSEVDYDAAASTITVAAPDEFKIKNIVDILIAKLTKRGVSLKFFDWGKPEPAGGSRYKQSIGIKQGIPKDKAKAITEKIKGLKIKVQSQVQDDQIRVTGKNKDDLQVVIQALRKGEWDIELQFVNYR